MVDFIKENTALVTAVLVAIISGIFYLFKKGGNSNNQSIKNVSDSSINQIGSTQSSNNKK